MDAIFKLVDQILRGLKRLVCQCAVHRLMGQVKEQWSGGVMWIYYIDSLVCEKVGTVVSPLIKNGLCQEYKERY